MKTPGVYRIYNKITKRNYIGCSSKDWRNRRNGHVFLLRHGKHNCKKMQDDWDKHGPESFKFFHVCDCPSDKVFEMEKVAADEFKVFDNEFGYNTDKMGSGRYRCGRKPDQERKIRFSLTLRPEIAARLAALMPVHDHDIIWLERGRMKGLKTGEGMGRGDKSTIGFRPESISGEELVNEYDTKKTEWLASELDPNPISQQLSESKRYGVEISKENDKLKLELDISRHETDEALAMDLDDKARYWMNRALKAEKMMVRNEFDQSL